MDTQLYRTAALEHVPGALTEVAHSLAGIPYKIVLCNPLEGLLDIFYTYNDNVNPNPL